jgi:TPR repeat protein
MLALLVPSSSHGMPDSFRHAVDLYDAPSRDGDAAANAGMGTLELYGWGVPRDLHKCLGHFRFANQRKHARGQTGLGVMHVHGFVVARDFNEAFKYLSDGCDQVRQLRVELRHARKALS